MYKGPHLADTELIAVPAMAVEWLASTLLIVSSLVSTEVMIRFGL